MDSELMKRPSLADEYVRRRAAEIILPEVLGWIGPMSPEREREAFEDLMKVASQGRDGYEMVKELEDYHGWAGGSVLVEILDGNWVTDAIDELTSQWVRCLSIQPQFKMGDTVATNYGHRSGEPGEIVRVYPERAKYGVHHPGQPPNSYTVLNFEDCSAVMLAAR